MNTHEWENVAREFTFDGTWRDIYVLNTDISAWQQVLDELRAGPYELKYFRDGVLSELPHVMHKTLSDWGTCDGLLSAFFAGIQANCHFFTTDEIEFDIDPREVRGQEQLDAIFEFMQMLSRVTGKAAILTEENGPERVIFRSHPDRAEVEYVPSPWRQ